MVCHICHDLESDVPKLGLFSNEGVRPDELRVAAEAGCSACLLLQDGILSFESPQHIQRVRACGPIETRRESRLGQRLPLIVQVHLEVGSSSLEFYRSDGKIQTSITLRSLISDSPYLQHQLFPNISPFEEVVHQFLVSFNQWPLIPVASHISMDSSSMESFGMARKWLDHCLQNHPTNLCTPKVDSILPTRVICVGNTSQSPFIYEPPPGKFGTYAALSYCWGKSRVFTTTISTLIQRKMGFTLNELPKTCRDAITVSRGLSIPYLWIDSLCIIQDSQADWETEAGQMCSVYQNALVTIAAVDSPNSNSGLFLTCPSRKTIKLKSLANDGRICEIFVRRAHTSCQFNFVHTHPETHCILTTRGWTLQEVILSQRMLWFTASELAWECGAESACECDATPTSEWIFQSDTRLMRTTLSRTSSHSTDLHHSWRALVQEFTRRDLTQATDRLPAISGLAASFKRHINSTYLFGLWKDELERHLLWCSDSFRNSASQISCQSPSLGQGYAPSWSWASIPGAIWFSNLANHTNFVSGLEILQVEVSQKGDNAYGPGTGTIIVRGSLIALELGVAEFLSVATNNTEGRDHFCSMDDWLPDPEFADREYLVGKPLFFLAIGFLVKFPNSAQSSISLCDGLLLQQLGGAYNTFSRLGFIEVHFNRGNGWGIWEQSSIKQRVLLV